MREKQRERERKREKERERERKREKERERERKREKRGDLKHLSVHQWIRSAIPDSQQPISPIGFLFLKLPPPLCGTSGIYDKN